MAELDVVKNVRVIFTADDWTKQGDMYIIKIPQSRHRRSDANFAYDVYALQSDGYYTKNTWNIKELQMSYNNSTYEIVLESEEAFAGKIVFAG